MDLFLYFLLIPSALLATFVGFTLKVVRENINRVQKGTKPEAGAAIFPSVVLVPLLYLLVTWGLNSFNESLGFYLVYAFFFLSLAYRFRKLRKHKLELDLLLKSNN